MGVSCLAWGIHLLQRCNGAAWIPLPSATSAAGDMEFSAAFLDAIQARQSSDEARRGAFVALVACADWEPWLPEAAGLLDARERERVGRKRRSSDRDLCALAYACHRLLLASVLDRPPQFVPLRRDEHGCPRLDGDVAWTSLSHSDGLIALAVSGVGRVGVDIEPRVRAAEMLEIAGRVAHPREMAALSTLPEPRRAAGLLDLWVRKEALLKAAGIGLAQPMESFEAPLDTPLPLPGGMDAQAPPTRIRMLDGGHASVAAVAARETGVVTCAWLRPRR